MTTKTEDLHVQEYKAFYDPGVLVPDVHRRLCTGYKTYCPPTHTYRRTAFMIL